MNEYRFRDTGQVVSEDEFRSMYENTSFPAVLNQDVYDTYRIDPVLQAPQPQTTDFQNVVRDGVVGDGTGRFFQAWSVVNWPQSRIDAAIQQAKQSKLNEINKWRLEANQSYFVWQGKNIQCDSLSRSDIDGVLGSITLTGSFPIGFPNAWKTMDNSYLPVPDIDTFKAMYTAMTNQGSLNFARAQQLKQAVNNATTLEEIRSISW